jgi:hypothetical protein
MWHLSGASAGANCDSDTARPEEGRHFLRRQLARPSLHVGLFVIAVVLLLFTRAMGRFFDLDEHQFVAPAVFLSRDGRLPYHDYPYFHMPTLVYINALVTSFSSHKLLMTRLVSVLCGSATLLVLFSVTWNSLCGTCYRRRWLFSGGIVLIYMCSRLFTYTNGWSWNHDPSVLCALGAFCLHVRGLRCGGRWHFAAAGALCGLAIGIRLSFALIFIPFACSLLIGKSSLARRQRLLALSFAALAAALALLPALAHWLADPDQFLFGNLGYPRLSTMFYSATDSRALTLFPKLGYALTSFLSDPGNAVLFAGCTTSVIYYARGFRVRHSEFANELTLVFALLPFLWIGVLGPSPTFYQYYYMVLPFMTLSAVYLIAEQRHNPLAMSRWARIMGWSLVIVALINFPRWYWQVIYLPTPSAWTPIQVHQVGRWIKHHSPRGARVLTIDPAFPLEAGMRVERDFAVGRFIMQVGQFMSERERCRQHMAWGEQLDRELATAPPDVFFFHSRTIDQAPQLLRYAQEHHYRHIATADGEFQMWVLPAGTADSGRGAAALPLPGLLWCP